MRSSKCTLNTFLDSPLLVYIHPRDNTHCQWSPHLQHRELTVGKEAHTQELGDVGMMEVRHQLVFLHILASCMQHWKIGSAWRRGYLPATFSIPALAASMRTSWIFFPAHIRLFTSTWMSNSLFRRSILQTHPIQGRKQVGAWDAEASPNFEAYQYVKFFIVLIVLFLLLKLPQCISDTLKSSGGGKVCPWTPSYADCYTPSSYLWQIK